MPPTSDPRALLGLLGVVFVGGACGTLLRGVLQSAAPAPPGGVLWSTFAINVTGSLLLGALLAALAQAGPDSGWRRAVRLGLGSGVLGGFTTYSTFAVQTVERVTAGSVPLALAYAGASVALGLIAAAGGYAVAHRVREHERWHRTAR